jgi:hypothetical protein
MKSVLIYTVHKAASMFLHQLTAEVAEEPGIRYYSINNDRHFDAIKSESWKRFIENENRTGCFGPIRAGAAEPCIPDDLQSYRVVLHLRDPRDVLTSLFYSHVYSHARAPGRFNPGNEQRKRWEREGIDRFVLEKAPATLDAYRELCAQLVGKGNVRFLKYETLVSDYSKWLDAYLSAFAHFDPPARKFLHVIRYSTTFSRLRDRLYRKHRREFSVSTENVRKHKRQITPGDHRRKLSARTIQQLDYLFRDVLETLEYDGRGTPRNCRLAAG